MDNYANYRLTSINSHNAEIGREVARTRQADRLNAAQANPTDTGNGTWARLMRWFAAMGGKRALPTV